MSEHEHASRITRRGFKGPGMGRVESTEAGDLRIGALVRNADLAADRAVRRDYGVLARVLVAGASGRRDTGRRRMGT